MRILHTADWHLGRKLEGRSRHDEQENVLDEICRIADEESVDAVLVAGDVFDTYNPPADAEALFYRTMTRLADQGRRAVVVIAGNHDSPDRLIASDPYARALGITTLGYPKDIPSLYQNGRERVACIESAPSFVRLRLPRQERVLSILALPYPSEARLRELFTASIADEEQATIDYNHRVRSVMEERARDFVAGEANIIASHLFVAGGEECESERPIHVGGAYTIEPGSFPSQASYVALGHLHRDQEKYGRAETCIRYSGSILQYSFSEEGQKKSVTIVDLDGAAASHRSITLSSGRQLHRWRVDGIDELERRLAGVGEEEWLSIDLQLDDAIPPDYLGNLRRAHPEILNCICRYKLTPEQAAEAQINVAAMTLEEQFKRFVAVKFNEPCNDAVLKLFLELAGKE
jgi:exonuclease SbcD